MSADAVANAASQLRRQIYKNRHDLWPGRVPLDPVEMLDPTVAAKFHGYSCVFQPEIANWPPNKQLAIAGQVDPIRRQITISEKFGLPSAWFTAAHELGHIVLYPPQRAFRERSIDAPRDHPQNRVERNVDRFAADFLMPEKLLRNRVMGAFGPVPIEVNDAVAFWLDPNDPERLLRTNPDSRERAFALARSPRDIAGNHIVPLHEQFKVSVKAMAYRLDELQLVRRHP